VAVVPSDHLPPVESLLRRRQQQNHGNNGSSSSNSSGGGGSLDAISAIAIAIPQGKAVALPSIQISEEEEKDIKRGQYGGKGDKPHLGGFTEFDVREEEYMREADPCIEFSYQYIMHGKISRPLPLSYLPCMNISRWECPPRSGNTS